MKRNKTILGLSLFSVALAVAGIAGMLLLPFLSQTDPESKDQRATPETRKAAMGNVPALRELAQRFPNDLETRYWLAAAIIESAKSNHELLESGSLLESIPEDSTPNWLPLWKRKRLAQLSLSLFAIQDLQAAEEPFQTQLIQQFEKVVSKQRFFTAEKVREDLQQVRDLLLNRWAYVEEKRLQTGRTIEQAYENRLAEIRPEMCPVDAVQLIERFIADMSDGHCYGYSPSIVRYGLPFRIRDTREGLVVESTHPTCSGIATGDLLQSINGKSIEEWVSLQESITSCSTAESRRANAIRNMSRFLVRLEGSEPSNSITVDIEHDGKTSSVNCKLLTEEQWRQGSGIMWLKPTKKTGQIGLVQIRSWAPEIMDATSEKAQRYREEIDRALLEVADSTDLILDIRGNTGGYDWLSTYFASHFIAPPFPVYILRYRSGDSGFTNSELKPAMSGLDYLAYQGRQLQPKLYVLVDELCFSASDTFLHVLSAHLKNRVVLIGRPSAAGIGGPNEVGKLRNTDFSVFLSHCKAFDSRGKELLEGKPETIHYSVQWTRADVVGNRDPDLEKALELIADDSSKK